MLQRLRPDISVEEYAALLEVKSLVADGKIIVRMNSCFDCVGGHMARIMGVNAGVYVTGTHGPLRELFFPSYSLFFNLVLGSSLRRTPSWLVLRAIDRFLAGQVPWRLRTESR